MARHPGNIERRPNGLLRVRLCVGGRYYRFSLRTNDRREAVQFARTKFAELEKQQARARDGFPTAVRVSALLAQFEREALPPLTKGTQASYRDSFKTIRPFFVTELRDPTVERIRAADVQAFLTWRRAHRIGGGAVSNRTCAKDRAVLHRLFSFAERLEYREGNPVARVAAPKADPRTAVILTDADYELLLAECRDPFLRLYTLALGETGARCESEVLWLTWADVDLDEGFLQIVSGRDGHRTKTGRTRWVPMSKRLTEAMQAHAAEYRGATYHGAASPWVFHHVNDSRHHTAGDRIGSLRRSFALAAHRATLPAGFTQHDLRHRRVTTLVQQGHDLAKIQKLAGHANIRTTMLYTHLVREDLVGLVQ